jgi:hypothetical protein
MMGEMLTVTSFGAGGTAGVAAFGGNYRQITGKASTRQENSSQAALCSSPAIRDLSSIHRLIDSFPSNAIPYPTHCS